LKYFRVSSGRIGDVPVDISRTGYTGDLGYEIWIPAERALDVWDAIVDVILKGSFLCTKAVSGLTTERGWGRIVNISSRAHLGNPGQANYSAAKAGLLGLTRALALELGRFGVTVNAVAPGIVDTEAVRALAHFDKIRGAAEKATPISRLGNVYDIADAVASWLRRGLATSREKYFM